MDSQSASRLSPRLLAQACASVDAAPPWSECPGVVAQIAAIIATIPDDGDADVSPARPV